MKKTKKTESRKIKAAIIGMGIGEKHFEAINNYKGSKVLLICEKDKKKIKILKKKYPKIEIITDENKIYENKDINLVSIASYDEDHYSQIIKSIKFNKNLIIEKPMCLKLNELHKINDLLKKNKKINILSNLVLRVNSRFSYFKQKIDKDKIYYMEADYDWGRVHKLYEWRATQKNYSITLGAGIHMIDLAMWILNKRPISVIAFGNNNATKGTNFKKLSFAVYIFKFPNNVILKVTANAASVHDHFHHLKIYEKNNSYINSYLGSYHFNSKNRFFNVNKRYPDKKNRKNLIRNFIDRMLLNKKPEFSVKDQVDLMSACFFADQSMNSGKEIKIKYFNK
jgi:predicted dehydrogenase